MTSFTFPRQAALLTLAVLGSATAAQAAMVEIKVMVQNLAPTNSVSFAPLHLGFHSGSFDAFN